MAETKKTNVFVPEVFADTLQTEYVGKLILGGLAYNHVGFEGTPGDTINFPYFGYLGDADVVAEATAADTTIFAGSKIAAVCKKAVKAVEISDEAQLGAVGLQDQLSKDFARGMAAAIDKALWEEALKATNVVGDGTGVITAALIVDAQAKLGDNADGAVLVVNSKMRADLYKDSNFADASKLGGPVQIGGLTAIGMLYGMPVFVSDKATKGLVIKPGALALAVKRQPIVETDRDILKGTSVMAANVHFAAALARPEGVCQINVL